MRCRLLALCLLPACGPFAPPDEDPSDTDTDGLVHTDDTGPADAEKWTYLLPQVELGQYGSSEALVVDEDSNVYAIIKAFGGNTRLLSLDTEGNKRWESTDLPVAFDDFCRELMVADWTDRVWAWCHQDFVNGDEGGLRYVRAFSTANGATQGTLAFTVDDWVSSMVVFPTDLDLDRVVVTVNNLQLGQPRLVRVDGPQGSPTEVTVAGHGALSALVMDSTRRLHMVAGQTKVLRYSEDLVAVGSPWEAPAGATIEALTVGPSNTLYVSLANPHRVQVLSTADYAPAGSFDLSWEPGPVVTASNGDRLVDSTEDGLLRFDDNDTKVWDLPGQASTPGSAVALEDGRALWSPEYALERVDVDGVSRVSLHAYDPHPAAVAPDGTIFVGTQADIDSSVSDAIRAFRGTPAAAGWSQARANGARTGVWR